MEYCTIVTNTSNIDEAKKIAHNLVENKLAACVNIIPEIISVYNWKNEICEDKECQLIIKTEKVLFQSVQDTILKLHSYELPEIIMLPIEKGYDKYLDWISKETK